MHRNDFFFRLCVREKFLTLQSEGETVKTELGWNTAKQGKGKGLGSHLMVRDLPCIQTGLVGPELPTSSKWGFWNIYLNVIHTNCEAAEILHHYLTYWSFLTNKQWRELRLCCMHIKYSTNCLALLNLSCINRLFVLVTVPLACQMIRKWFWIS